LKLPIHGPCLGGLGHISPSDVTRRPNPEKVPPCTETHCVSCKA